MGKLDLGAYAHLNETLGKRHNDIQSARNTLLKLTWSKPMASGDQYFPEPHPHLHVGGHGPTLFLAVSYGPNSGKPGRNLIRNGKLTHGWRDLLETLPACAPWGNAMWEKAARFIDHTCGTRIIETKGTYSDLGITKGVDELAFKGTTVRLRSEERTARMNSGSWR